MKKKSKYRTESLPQYILRCAEVSNPTGFESLPSGQTADGRIGGSSAAPPIGRTAMRSLIARTEVTECDVQDLENEIERINLRSIELLEKHARPEFIERAREELNLLALAKSVLCDG